MQTLSDWLDRLEQRHPRSIDLGLDRVAAVYGRLGSPPPAKQVITVAGTNGKGSTVSYIDNLARAAAWRTGCYTSPHLVAFNERIVIDGQAVSDRALCAVFEEIEAALETTSLSYFEFTTLAALLLFSRSGLDLAVLEVGLGGRLDAVNVIDADVAVITSIGMDHMDWLGDDLESIGREKSGIMRPGKTVICAERMPPATVLEHARMLAAPMWRIGTDFDWQDTGTGLCITTPRHTLEGPFPPMYGAVQNDNLAAACAALQALPEPPRMGRAILQAGLRVAALPGRFQQIQTAPEVFLDVAHNLQAAAQLRSSLETRACAGRTWLIMAMLADKQVVEVARCLDPVADQWWLSGLGGPRGLSAADLQARLAGQLLAPVHTSENLPAAFSAVLAQADENDRLIIFGSFLTVAEAIRYWNR